MKKKGFLCCCLLLGIILACHVIVVPNVTFAETGVTKTRIKVGHHDILSGPAAYVGIASSHGLRIYIDYINDQGGVLGRKIKLIDEDNRYMPLPSVAAVKKLISRDKVFAFVGNMGSVPNIATMKQIQEAKIPSVAPSAWSKPMFVPPKRYIFPKGCLYEYTTRVIVDYIVNDFKNKSPKIVSIYQDDEWGANNNSGLEGQLKKYGLKLKGKFPFKRGSVDQGTQVINAVRSGAEYVHITATTSAIYNILNEAKKVGFTPKFTCTYTDVKILNLAGEKADGLITPKDAVLKDSNASGMAKARENYQKYNPKATLGTYSILGYVSGMLLVEGLKRTGANLTREGLVNTLESFKNVDVTDGIMAPFSYGPGERIPSNKCFLVKGDSKEKRWVKITDWRSPGE